MTFALRVKRAMLDVLPSYKGELDSSWGNLDSSAYYLFCNRNGGTFSDFPSRYGQTKDFLDLVDRYEDAEYTRPVVEEAPKKTGVDLRQFTPDRQPLPDKSPDERRKLNAVVNENVGIKLSPPAPVIPDPAKELEKEPKNDKPEADAEPTSNSTDSNTESKPDIIKLDEPAPETSGGSNAEGKQETVEGANTEGAEKQKAPEVAKSKPQAGKLPSVNKIKLR